MTAVLERYELKDRPALQVVTSDTQCDEYTAALIELKEQDHLSADDRKYARLLAALIEKYETEKYAISDASPLEVLRELMEANSLRQKDLIPILGGHESVVSEIVNGKRPLSKHHIEKLSQRFKVSPAIFFPRAIAAHR